MSSLDCQKCGACCFDQLVALMPGDDVPLHMTIDRSLVTVEHNSGLPDGLTPLDHCIGRVMRNHFNRCVALEGKRGSTLTCKIYDSRPVVCKTMKKGSWACLEVRARWYL